MIFTITMLTAIYTILLYSEVKAHREEINYMRQYKCESCGNDADVVVRLRSNGAKFLYCNECADDRIGESMLSEVDLLDPEKEWSIHMTVKQPQK